MASIDLQMDKYMSDMQAAQDKAIALYSSAGLRFREGHLAANILLLDFTKSAFEKALTIDTTSIDAQKSSYTKTKRIAFIF